MKKKRVLVPYFEDYYLFEYLSEVSVTLQKSGYEVTVLTADKTIFDRFNESQISVDYVPLIIRLLRRRSGNLIIRSLLWIAGYIWIFAIRKQFDFAIIPWDNKPLWYIILRRFPSLTVHNTTNLMDLNFEITSYKSSSSHQFSQFLEKITGMSLLPRLGGVILKHNRFWYLDKVFGMKSKNLVQGFSEIEYMTVTGNKIKDTLIEAGIDLNKTKIIPAGNPAYDGFINYSKDFTSRRRWKLKESLGLNPSLDLYSMFLSPSFFSEVQQEEVITVFGAILEFNANASLCLKFHPKTEKKFIDTFEGLLSERTDNYKVISGFTGDQLNLDIILSSECILQKQSTVGFIAMMSSIPIISYNIAETDYYDDMYKYMSASWHCETAEEILYSLNLLNEEDELTKLRDLQKVACSNFCIRNNSVSESIAQIIDEHFVENH